MGECKFVKTKYFSFVYSLEYYNEFFLLCDNILCWNNIYNGVVIRVYSILLNWCDVVKLVEALACLNGVRLARELQAQKVVFEMDCQAIVSTIRCGLFLVHWYYCFEYSTNLKLVPRKFF